MSPAGRSVDDPKEMARTLLAELAADGIELNEADGIEIRTPKDLERALVAQPDLRARIENLLTAARSAPAPPPELEDDLRIARGGEERHRSIGDRAALDSAAAAWSRILEHPIFSSASERFRLAALISAGVVLASRYRVYGAGDDLNRAIDLFGQAVEATPPDSTILPIRRRT